MNSIYTLLVVFALSCFTSAEDKMMNSTSEELSSNETMTTEMSMSKEELTTMPPTMHSSFMNNSSSDSSNFQSGSNSFGVGSSSFNVESGRPQGSDFQPSNWPSPSSGENIQHQFGSGNFSSQEQDKNKYEVVNNEPSSTTNMLDMMHGDDPMTNNQGSGSSEWGKDNQHNNNMNHPMMPTTEGKMDKNSGSWNQGEKVDHSQHGMNGTASIRSTEASLIVVSTVLSAALFRLH